MFCDICGSEFDPAPGLQSYADGEAICPECDPISPLPPLYAVQDRSGARQPMVMADPRQGFVTAERVPFRQAERWARALSITHGKPFYVVTEFGDAVSVYNRGEREAV